MKLFGFGKAGAGEVEALRLAVENLSRELATTQSALRTLEGEQLALHDQVRKWMRRASAAERNQERRDSASDSRVAAMQERSQRLWGAAARIAARREAASSGAVDLGEEESYGVHP